MGASHSFAESREVLDEMVTRSRGEIKRMNSPKVTSSGTTPVIDRRSFSSPRLSATEKAYSPRVRELTPERSPRMAETRSFKLGEGSK